MNQIKSQSKGNKQVHFIKKLEKGDDFNRKQLIDMIIDLALVTENKTLEYENTSKALDFIINNEDFGFYCVSPIEGGNLQALKGVHLLTKSFDISSNRMFLWIQTVYVEKEFRKVGVFSSHINFTENYVKEHLYGNSIRLYVDKENSSAKAVYENLGFSSMQNNVVERDFFFDKLTEEQMTSYKTSFDLIDFETNNQGFEILNKVKEVKFISQMKNKESIIKLLSEEEVKGIEAVISNKDFGRVISFWKGNVLIALFYIFYEFSDWRNSFIWWIYQIQVNVEMLAEFNQNFKDLVNQVVIFSSDKSCTVRFIFDNEIDLQGTLLSQAHFTIEEKLL